MHLNLYGLLIALGVLAAVAYMVGETKRLGLSRDLAVDIALWAVPLAIVFSRIYYVVFTWQRYRQDLLSILRIWEGGLAIYGGVIGGALGVYLLARRRKLAYEILLDLVAPGLILGQAIGRWGNFFNGEAYGSLVQNSGFQFFPVAVLVQGQWHLATFFYESVWNLLGFLLLLKLRKPAYQKGRGWIFASYLLWYGLGRLVIEGLRSDSLMLGSLRVSQLLSLVMVVAAGLAMLLRLHFHRALCLPLVAGLAALLLAALGQGWALVPGYVLMATFVLPLLYLLYTSKVNQEDT